jgi:septal ring factor EnvC (AmiA/AmiB activator)
MRPLFRQEGFLTTGVLYVVVITLTFACAGLTYQWLTTAAALNNCNDKRSAAEQLLSEERITTAELKSVINDQNNSLNDLETAKLESEKRAQLAERLLANERKRNKVLLDDVSKVDASKVATCQDAMPLLNKVLSGARR